MCRLLVADSSSAVAVVVAVVVVAASLLRIGHRTIHRRLEGLAVFVVG